MAPRRENTKVLYIDIKAKTKREGIIQVRALITKETNFRIEYIDALTESAEQYEKETTNFSLTTF